VPASKNRWFSPQVFFPDAFREKTQKKTFPLSRRVVYATLDFDELAGEGRGEGWPGKPFSTNLLSRKKNEATCL
jgi:hypothetical protein